MFEGIVGDEEVFVPEGRLKRETRGSSVPTGDPTTVVDQVNKLRERFSLSEVVLAGDRGMLTQTQIETLKEHPGLGWISALRSASI